MVPIMESSASQNQQLSLPPPVLVVPHSPLSGPVHDVVCRDEWRYNVEDLCAGSSPRVEDGSMGRAGEGVLSVRGEAVGHDALLGLGRSAWMVSDGVSALILPSTLPKVGSRSLSPSALRICLGLSQGLGPGLSSGFLVTQVGLLTNLTPATDVPVTQRSAQICQNPYIFVCQAAGASFQSRELPQHRKKNRASNPDTVECCGLTCCTCRGGHRRRRHCEVFEWVSS